MKKNIKIYKPTKTWMYGHDDLRTLTDQLSTYITDLLLSTDIDDELEQTDVNFRMPYFLGKIIICWDHPKEYGKRLCSWTSKVKQE